MKHIIDTDELEKLIYKDFTYTGFAYDAISVEELRKLISNSPQVPEGYAWISVEDRLPPIGEVVLVYGQTIRQALDAWVIYYESPVGFSTITVETGEGWSEHEFEEVTHWRPLPQPPKP